MAADGVVNALRGIDKIVGLAPRPPRHQGASGHCGDSRKQQRQAQISKLYGRDRVACALPRRGADGAKRAGQHKRGECGKEKRKSSAKRCDLFKPPACGGNLLDGIDHDGVIF